MAFWLFTGSADEFFPSRNLLARVGKIYDFGVDTPPKRSLPKELNAQNANLNPWSSSAGPASDGAVRVLSDIPQPVAFVKTSASVTPAATLGTDGTAVNLAPATGYGSIRPTIAIATATTVVAETLTFTVTATRNDASTGTATVAVTTTAATAFSQTALAGLFKDGTYITALAVTVQSSINSSTGAGTVKVVGYNAL